MAKMDSELTTSALMQFPPANAHAICNQKRFRSLSDLVGCDVPVFEYGTLGIIRRHNAVQTIRGEACGSVVHQ